ncbi:MAG: hypothetical protein V7K71_15985 [Nostoc sp.]|uniref:hypothetical protein n=1 Tax=Nostoc sp. TaxID=1180 RepID=UPI002FFD540F
MGNRLLICAFLFNPYPALYLTIVFTNIAILIKNFRIELYHWLCQRCKITVNNLLSRMPDDFRKQHEEALLIYAQNSLHSTEFAPEIFIANFDFNKSISDESFARITVLLTAYVDRKIKFQLFSILRKLVGDDTIGHNNVGLAAKASDQKVQSSLERAGYNQEKKSHYMFFFRRFKQVRNSQILPSKVAISKWNEADYQKLADIYNIEKLKNWQFIDSAKARIMLENIGQAIRDYERSFVANFTVNINDHNVETEVIISEYDSSFLLDLCDFIRNLLPILDGKNKPTINRRIIFAILNHGFNINQVDIAEKYENDKRKQYIVSRELAELYKEISSRYFEFHHTQLSSENIALFIKLLKNKIVDDRELNMPVLSRVFVDDFIQIFKSDTISSETSIRMKENIMTLMIEEQYKINLDECAKQYLSRWIRERY